VPGDRNIESTCPVSLDMGVIWELTWGPEVESGQFYLALLIRH